MTLVELYGLQHAEGPAADTARALLRQADWYAVNAEFDPKTGDALPQAMSGFLSKLTRKDPGSLTHDRLWRITEHARPSVGRLLRSLNESPRREHALMSVQAVRELDANSFIKLSNRPGRNIREKLAGKPYLQAVRRFQSVDLPENRLLKAFVTRLAELLELRRDCLDEEEDELFVRIRSWLRSDGAQAIARWDNLPPNNTLLAHRDYRRVWDAWRWMQSLDDDIAHDLAQLESREETMREWQDYGRLHLEGCNLFAEQPLLFNYNAYAIRPWSAPIQMRVAARKVARFQGITEILNPACVDLVNPRPRYATASQPYGALPETYLWQQWHNDRETVDLGLFCSDAVFLHADATVVASSDLFFSSKQANDLMASAARAFATRLRETFKNDSLVWLVPDSVNDFEIEILRRSLNSRFARAEPLPRSVAAVFEQVDYSGIKREGFTVVVVDSIGGKICATKLIAKFDQELLKRLPETKGIYWERCPPVTLSDSEQRAVHHARRRRFDLLTLDSTGNWHGPGPTIQNKAVSPKALKEDSHIGPFDLLIDLKMSPVAGGARLHSLQLQAGDIPLWRDKMPELSIKAFINGRYQRIYLVSRDTPPVKPIRDQPIPIQVAENFTLPAGRPFYRFPLFQGEKAEEMGFDARLDSPAFPLKSDVVCKLRLTFSYGADEPYQLVFTPLDPSLPPVRATWKRTEEKIVTDAPAPQYPTPKTWESLQNERTPNGGTRDLLDWSIGVVRDLYLRLFTIPTERHIGEIVNFWKEDRNGDCFTFAFCDHFPKDVFIHEKSLVNGLSYRDFAEGDVVSFECIEYNGRYNACKVAGPDYMEEIRLMEFDNESTRELVKWIRKAFYVPYIRIWSDGRSILDDNCPTEFKETISNRINNIASLIEVEQVPQQVRTEMLFVLACLHKDAPEECVQWITEQVESGGIRNPQAVGFALGDVTEEWQKYLFDCIASNSNKFSISVLAYAIWREQHFVGNFTMENIKSILNGLSQRLANVSPLKLNLEKRKNEWLMRSWMRSTAEPLELLLGLLRIRDSTDPEIRMLLQPHQKITKLLADQVERVAEIIAESNVELFSRVQINVNKPERDRTPDLLYALRLYLTGDDGANAIHITSISDSDDD